MRKIILPKRLTLKLARKYCLMQWRWIIRQRKAGSKVYITELKRQWLKLKGIEPRRVRHSCFYCEYAEQYYLPAVMGNRCPHCPGRKIDPGFHCGRTAYDWQYSPKEFYRKLLSLKRIEVNHGK